MKKWMRLNKLGQLYMEVVLVYFDVPLLFVCCDENYNKYLVECVDEEDEVYLISPITKKWLLKLLKKEKTMEECLRQNKKHILTKIWYSAEKDNFEENICNSSELSIDELPDKGAYLEYHSEEVERYQESIEKDLRSPKATIVINVPPEIANKRNLNGLFHEAKTLAAPTRQRREYTQDLRGRGKYGKYRSDRISNY